MREYAVTHEQLREDEFKTEHEYHLASRRQVAYIERLRKKGHAMLQKKWGKEDEMTTLIQIVRHQLASNLESIDQIREMLLKSGVTSRKAKKIIRLAQQAA